MLRLDDELRCFRHGRNLPELPGSRRAYNRGELTSLGQPGGNTECQLRHEFRKELKKLQAVRPEASSRRSQVVKSKTHRMQVFDFTTCDLTTFGSEELVADDSALEDRARENLQVEREADGKFLPAED